MSSHITSRQPGISSWFQLHVPAVHEKRRVKYLRVDDCHVLEEIYD